MQALRDQIVGWLFRARVPDKPPVRLAQRRIFILPTSGGLLLGMTLLLMLMGCINYNLGLGYILTFLLAAIGLVSMLHTFRNLAHLELRPGRADPVFAGEEAAFPVLVDNPTALSRMSIALLPLHALPARSVTGLVRSRALHAEPLRRAAARPPARSHAAAEVAVFTTYPLGTVPRVVLRRTRPEPAWSIPTRKPAWCRCRSPMAAKARGCRRARAG